MPYIFCKMCGYKNSRCKSCWNHGKDHLKIGLCKLATAQHMVVISSAWWIIFIGNSCNRILNNLILLITCSTKILSRAISLVLITFLWLNCPYMSPFFRWDNQMDFSSCIFFISFETFINHDWTKRWNYV